ncbi:MAG: hypothetical protein IPK10_05425 [Bacteroidetes bacterium]|nr:hypothetical protein [Bacteroidota bacterium]
MINRSGILESVESFREGAVSVQENLAYDIESGAAIVNSSKDEFNRNKYSVSQPAYWNYSNMGGAYRSAAIKFVIDPTLHKIPLNGDFIFDLNTYAPYGNLLKHGDILLPLTALDEQKLRDYNIANQIKVSSMRYWISQPLCTSNGNSNAISNKVIMNDNGDLLELLIRVNRLD